MPAVFEADSYEFYDAFWVGTCNCCGTCQTGRQPGYVC